MRNKGPGRTISHASDSVLLGCPLPQSCFCPPSATATCLSDYQNLDQGGSGYLRLYQFSPSNNVIHVSTCSPYLDQYLGSFNDSPSQFDIPYTMDNARSAFQVLGSATVASGASASLLWTNLSPGSNYEWYATVSDGVNTAPLPANTFTIVSGNIVAPVLKSCLGPATGGGFFRARYEGYPGATYTVERATVLSGTWDWYTNVAAPIEDQGQGIGVFEFNENPGVHAHAFFRVVFPSYTP